MASAAFKSTKKRRPIGELKPAADDPASANRKSSAAAASHRRSRSLSCFGRQVPDRTPEAQEFHNPTSRFVNKVKGSTFPEISLEDLAIELFEVSGDRGHPSSCGSESTSPVGASQRWGRSVSWHGSRVGGGGGDVRGSGVNNSAGGRIVSESKGNSRPRRSL